MLPEIPSTLTVDFHIIMMQQLCLEIAHRWHISCKGGNQFGIGLALEGSGFSGQEISDYIRHIGRGIFVSVFLKGSFLKNRAWNLLLISCGPELRPRCCCFGQGIHQYPGWRLLTCGERGPRCWRWCA